MNSYIHVTSSISRTDSVCILHLVTYPRPETEVSKQSILTHALSKKLYINICLLSKNMAAYILHISITAMAITSTEWCLLL